jgi:sugar lactone lactonase YvrE
MTRFASMTLAAALSSCSSGSPVTPDADADAQWHAVVSHYGTMRAVAGAGETDSGTNEWLPAFEGAAASDAELSRPHMAMADDAGNIYIADKEAHAIRKVTPAGTITTYAGTGTAGAVDDTPGPATQRALANPNGLFVRGDGTLYILDLDHARIRKVTPDGTMTTLVTAPGGIALGRGLWVDGPEASERVYFASGNVVMRWTAAGGLTSWAGGFASLGNIAMDRNGRLLVADRGGNRVYAVTETTTGVTSKVVVAGNGSTGAGLDGAPAVMTALEGVRAVYPADTDDGDGFFAGTHEGCQLWFIDARGIAHLFLDGKKDAHAGVGEPFDSPGKKVSELRSVVVDPRGNVLFVDDDRGFVRLIERR